MFSLIITIISIALVAALALATLYYGGAAFNKSSAEANAGKLILQGQQLLGAADLYHTDNRSWPATAQALIDGKYLKEIPSAEAVQWEKVGARPVFIIETASDDVCKKVNRKAYGQEGILSAPYTGYTFQCYAHNSTNYTVFGKSDEIAAAGTAGDDARLPALRPGPVPTDAADPAWDSAPGSTGGAGAGGGGGGGGGVALTSLSSLALHDSVKDGYSNTDLLVRNDTASPVTFSSLSNTGPFWAGLNTCDGMTLAPNQTCTLQFQFSPTAATPLGAQTGTATLVTSAGTQSIALTGTHLAPPTFSPSPLNFASAVGSSSTLEVTLTNTLTDSMKFGFTQFYWETADKFSFSYTGGSPSCADLPGSTLASGQSCKMTITFTPSATGAVWGRFSQFFEYGGGWINADVDLNGTGTAP